VRLVSILAAHFLISGVLAWCQVQPARPASDTAVEVFGGFALGAGGPLGTNPGFNAGVDFKVYPRIFVVADVGHFIDTHEPSNNTTDTSILFGPRYMVRLSGSSRAAVFSDVLLGADVFHNSGQSYTYAYNNATSFAVAVDGGLDYRLSKHLGLRGEAGYEHTSLTNSTYSGPVTPATTANNRARVEADLVFRF
jgi:hypothetical protein